MITPWLSQNIEAITLPTKWILLNFLGGVSQGNSIVCLGQCGVNQCLIFVYNSLAVLRRSRLLSHITRLCTTLTFSSVMAAFGRPDRPSSPTLYLSSSQTLLPSFTLCYKRVSMKSSWISLGGIPFLQKYLIAALIANFFHFANVSHLPFLRGCIFQKLLLAWKFSCINKKVFFLSWRRIPLATLLYEQFIHLTRPDVIY